MRGLAVFAAMTSVALAGERPEILAGYDRLDIPADHRSGLVQGSVWYPAGTRTYAALVGDNPVFRGTRALVGADVQKGSYPLVVLSHGSGGNMDSLGWLSSGLARRGALVLAVNHPGSTSGDSSPRRSARFGERVRDLSSALDHLLDDPVFGPLVDRDRIYSLGFSLGGITALQSAGLEYRAEIYGDYCLENPASPGCVFFGKGGVDFHAVDEKLTEGNYADFRLAGVIAVDPGAPFAIAQDSIATMKKPVLFINLGEQDSLWREVNEGPKGSDLAGRLENAAYAEISPADHFSFLGLCKPEGAALLKEEQDDPVCDEPEGADRAAVHQRVVEVVSRFLELERDG
ncbi:hypothetical protein E1297_13620 [Roseibium sp. RKSG952]|nr:hypothetical protein [Roseibium sp. RKSG952]